VSVDEVSAVPVAAASTKKDYAEIHRSLFLDKKVETGELGIVDRVAVYNMCHFHRRE
jgi:hypothetical protein